MLLEELRNELNTITFNEFINYVNVFKILCSKYIDAGGLHEFSRIRDIYVKEMKNTTQSCFFIRVSPLIMHLLT